jgi:hypothetical protein
MVITSDRFLRFLTYFLGGGQLPAAMAFFPFVIINSQVKPTPELINHERIHLRQQLELLIIPFYILYLIEFYTKGYYNVSFEREAYENDDNLNYLKSRKLFSFIKYLKK